MTEAEAATLAAEKLSKMPTKAVCDMFDIISIKLSPDPRKLHKKIWKELLDVREWIMRDLERRNKDSFNVWMDSIVDSPAPFFQTIELR